MDSERLSMSAPVPGAPRAIDAAPLRLAHVSDLHLPFEPELGWRQRLSKRQLSAWSWRRRRELHQGAILDALAADLRGHALDHIVVTGDVTNFSLPAEFRQAAAWLEALAPAERISLVPGNHDALVAMPAGEALDLWRPWHRTGDEGWPFVHRVGGVSLVGVNSARPTAPLLARGHIGGAQLARLERVLVEEGAAGRVRIVLLHHPAAAGAVRWRKALGDGSALRAVLQRAGAELVLHGHARDARLDAIDGPREPIPCLCVPSSSALPNPSDEGARWHRLELLDPARLAVEVRRWSVAAQAFVAAGGVTLCLPRQNAAA